MAKLKAHQIEAGANGDRLVTNGGVTQWSPSPAIPSVLDDLTDVDTKTAPPQTNQVLTFNGQLWVPAKASTGTSSPMRGEWSSDALAWREAFGSGTIPAQITPENSGSGSAPSVVTVASAGRPSPPPDTNTSQMYVNGFAGYSGLTLSVAGLGVSNVTRVRFYLAASSGSRSPVVKVNRNGTAVVNTTLASGGAIGWTQYEFTATSADTFEWRIDSGPSGFSSIGHLWVTAIEMYATDAPYMTDNYVIHLGRLWRSAVDGNTSEPGADATWVEVPLGYDQATASRPTGIAAGAHVFDSTLGKPVWWDGAGWVDATGAAV